MITATSSDDVIHVAAGTYQTGYPDYVAQTENAKWGPNLKAKLIGEGTTRGDVVLESHGEYRTLRMAAGSWLENVTIVGCTDISKADKGGAIEMSGGTVTNCVIRDGKAYASSNQAGGNLYMNSDAALVVDCLISGGVGKSHGGNVCLVKGTIRASTITKGTTYLRFPYIRTAVFFFHVESSAERAFSSFSRPINIGLHLLVFLNSFPRTFVQIDIIVICPVVFIKSLNVFSEKNISESFIVNECPPLDPLDSIYDPYPQQNTGCVDQDIPRLHGTAGDEVLVDLIADSVEKADQEWDQPRTGYPGGCRFE